MIFRASVLIYIFIIWCFFVSFVGDRLIHITGFSTFTSEEKMPPSLKKNQQRLWQIPTGTPFPSEMSLHHTPRTGHVSIKPTNPVSPETFVKVICHLHSMLLVSDWNQCKK